MAESSLLTSTGILRFLFDFSHRALTLDCADLTHADSLLVPPGGANPANWVLGHILRYRSQVLDLLHEQPLWSEADGEPYETGSKGLDPARARPWESLVADIDATQERIRRGLERLDPADLEVRHVESARRPRGEQLHFLHFHESYHVGQLGILRRIAGKPGAI
jgi:hypothetical protein